MAEDISLKIQKGKQIPTKINPKKSTPRYIIVKYLKIKTEKNPGSSKRNNLSIGEKQYK